MPDARLPGHDSCQAASRLRQTYRTVRLDERFSRPARVGPTSRRVFGCCLRPQVRRDQPGYGCTWLSAASMPPSCPGPARTPARKFGVDGPLVVHPGQELRKESSATASWSYGAILENSRIGALKVLRTWTILFSRGMRGEAIL